MVQTLFLDGKACGAEAIYARLRAAIEAGELAQGEALPTIRALAEQLAVNRNTVAAAYRRLIVAGLAESAGRGGTRVAPRSRVGLPAGVHAYVPQPGLAELASGNPDPALLPDFGPALARLVSPPALYGQPCYEPELLAYGRDWWQRTGQIDAEFVDPLLVHGALDGIERVLAAWLAPGDTVLVEDPCFPGSLALLKQAGYNLIGLPLDDEGIVPEALEAALARKPKALVWTPYSHNPTGINTTPARAAQLRAVLAGVPDLLLVEDDHFAAFAPAATPSLVTAGHSRWAALRSLSKHLGPDMRLAFLVGDALTLARVQRRQYLGPRWPSFVLQRLALALLADPATDTLRNRAAALYAERHAALCTELAALDLKPQPGGGLNVWLPLADDAAVAQALAARGYLVRTGEAFRVTRTLSALRITSAALTPAAARTLATALAQCLGGLGVAA
ncbi:aminotransferase class I/II-fold pyridoxal phosphate-dependent enzyme [Chitinolyticbacter meiyuanensis]|uniref:aminotransferase class I/II-fold pyridoxal phosphate-dependent enzyme n=1 Tax=Chitinolyticbacter meiyuanensis TaxID=682798 RepID=UPI0011E5E7C3|nr:aminotransferase class I/II-fold pyridoxal phosphate-dependent enzyme [Chitinolyticbacter meiyuanensis]